jgi:2-polyprenyl-6-methoxyphenol hydroxylase-like FAD-dependent oxidoreductase
VTNGKVIVIGAGIGGLAAAHSLLRSGKEVVVFERLRELHEIGSGLTLWVNAMRSLEKIGLADIVRPRGAIVDRIENFRWDGHQFKTLPIRRIEHKYGTPSVSIHRAELQNTLAEALPDGVLRLGSEYTAFEQDGNGVTARFADGHDERADVLVGADGIRSTVRTQLFGAPQPRYSGYTCWRSAARLEHPKLEPELYTQLYGRGSNFGIFPIGDNNWSWYGTKMTAPGGGAGGDRAGWKREATEQFRNWLEPVPAVIEATDEQVFHRQDIYDLAPIETWGEGRVVLLGDAAHATTPTLGQGGCMAIEDSVVLGRVLQAAGDVPAALRSYWEQRRDRANGIVRSARRQGVIYHGATPALGAVRYFMLSGPVPVAMRVVDGLMGYEA